MTPADLAAPTRSVSRVRWRNGAGEPGERITPTETAIALVHDATTTAVMMATPADIEDFALGFSLTEGIINSMGDVKRLEVIAVDNGIEARMWLAADAAATLTARRRRLVGPTGCGLCGIDSLAEAMRPPPRVTDQGILPSAAIGMALTALTDAQRLGVQTRAVHAAGWWNPTDGLVALREDVGRHNALDKLAGALARDGVRPETGILALTSRVSVEMVQKAAAIGAPVIAAISAPTTLALRMAEEAGITLIAIARADGFEIFTHPERIGL